MPIQLTDDAAKTWHDADHDNGGEDVYLVRTVDGREYAFVTNMKRLVELVNAGEPLVTEDTGEMVMLFPAHIASIATQGTP